MTDILLMIYPILFLGLFFYRPIIYRRDEFCPDFLPIGQSKRIQGLACLFVILHHLTQELTSYGSINKGLITILASMGILFTSVFFFFSGYGLIVSYRTRDSYLSDFLYRRIPLVLFPFWLSNIIYLAYLMIKGTGHMTGRLALDYITGLKLINSNGWFIIEIVVLYLAFYFFFRHVPNKDMALILLSVFTLCLIGYSKSLGTEFDLLEPKSRWFKGEWWFNSTITFVAGLYFGRLRDGIFKIFKKIYFIITPLTIAAFILLFSYEEKIRKTYGYRGFDFELGGMSPGTRTMLAQAYVCLAFVILIVLLGMKIESTDVFSAFIGTVIMETFLIHHLVMDIISGDIIRNDILRFFLVIAVSIILAYLLNCLNKIIFDHYYKAVSGIRNRFLGNNSEVVDATANMSEYNEEHLSLESINRLEHKRRVKKYALIILACLGVTGVSVACTNAVRAKFNIKYETERLSAASVGDEVCWGRSSSLFGLKSDSLTWIVIEKDDDSCTLLSKYVLGGAVYGSSHEAVNYEESVIRQLINSNEYLGYFTGKEMDHMISDELGDYISLLTVSQAANLTPENRVAIATKESMAKGVNNNEYSKVHGWDYKTTKASWWRLKPDSDNLSSVTAPIVTVDGDIVMDGKYVNKPNGAVRPVIRIDF